MASSTSLFRMVLTYAEGPEDEISRIADHTISVTEIRRRNKRTLRLTAENLQTQRTYAYPEDSDYILKVLPLEYWPPFLKQSLWERNPAPQQDALIPECSE